MRGCCGAAWCGWRHAAAACLQVGDVLLAAAFVSYAAPFNMQIREQLVNQRWTPDLIERGIPMTAVRGGGALAMPAGRRVWLTGEQAGQGHSGSTAPRGLLRWMAAAVHGCAALPARDAALLMPCPPPPPPLPPGACPPVQGIKPLDMLAESSSRAKWANEGLPIDPLSVENGAIMTSASRWSLMIDPQLQVGGGGEGSREEGRSWVMGGGETWVPGRAGGRSGGPGVQGGRCRLAVHDHKAGGDQQASPFPPWLAGD